MDDTIEIILAVLLSVIIFFIFPVYIAYEKKDDLAYALSTKYVSDFVEEVKIKGYLSADMYQELNDKLLSTGNTFDIHLEHRAVKVYPNGSGSYNRVEEIYTEKQILDTLNKEDAGIDYDASKTIVNVLGDSIPTDIQNIPFRASLFDIKSNDDRQLAIYTMNIGDEFNVRVKNNNVSIAASLFNSFTTDSFGTDTTRIYVNYGAVITAEKYWN